MCAIIFKNKDNQCNTITVEYRAIRISALFFAVVECLYFAIEMLRSPAIVLKRNYNYHNYNYYKSL